MIFHRLRRFLALDAGAACIFLPPAAWTAIPTRMFYATLLRMHCWGAAGLPDIGYWFPPGDPACKDIPSLDIVAKAVL